MSKDLHFHLKMYIDNNFSIFIYKRCLLLIHLQVRHSGQESYYKNSYSSMDEFGVQRQQRKRSLYPREPNWLRCIRAQEFLVSKFIRSILYLTATNELYVFTVCYTFNSHIHLSSEIQAQFLEQLKGINHQKRQARYNLTNVDLQTMYRSIVLPHLLNLFIWNEIWYNKNLSS